ncbi:MAG TPA: hypothetical protein VFX97_02830 [Pyrinomonadaceae bacterium]|nr:hypothetical protein [Pyrinomonadaceae bacterium]
MRKTTIAILALLISSAATFAQEHKERTAPPVRPPQTQTPPQSEAPSSSFRYTSPEGRYTVLLPAQPKISSQQVNTPDGLPMTQYMATAAGSSGMFMVAYFDYANDVVFSLDKARDGMVNSIKGTLLDEHSMSLGGAPGRQIKVTARTEQGLEFIDRARFYDVKPRVFVLQCITPKSIDSPALAEKCEQFFDSFRVRSTP